MCADHADSCDAYKDENLKEFVVWLCRSCSLQRRRLTATVH